MPSDDVQPTALMSPVTPKLSDPTATNPLSLVATALISWSPPPPSACSLSRTRVHASPSGDVQTAAFRSGPESSQPAATSTSADAATVWAMTDPGPPNTPSSGGACDQASPVLAKAPSSPVSRTAGTPAATAMIAASATARTVRRDRRRRAEEVIASRRDSANSAPLRYRSLAGLAIAFSVTVSTAAGRAWLSEVGRGGSSSMCANSTAVSLGRGERNLTGEAFECDASECVDVAGVVGACSFDLLWAEVIDRAGEQDALPGGFP